MIVHERKDDSLPAADVAPPPAGILHWGAEELAQRIARRELSAREVVEAHMARIEEVNPRLGAVVVSLFESARAEATVADDRQARGEPLGPLHGVPFTVKESFDVTGTAVTAGLTTRTGHVSQADAPLVARLRAAGGILLGKTNVPQLMVLHESSNPVYGRTNNPWRLDRAAGGSTGGEAAAIAAYASPLGLGSDLGGSIRIPAHFCGICGFKPTSGRLTRRGSFENFRGLEAMVFQSGPLARHVADLDLALRILSGPLAGRTDIFPDTAPRPWLDYQAVNLRGLKIGVCEDDGFFRPSPAIRRAVAEAAAALAERGAILEPFAPPRMPEPVELYAGLMTADGAADLWRLAAGSKFDPLARRLLRLMSLPRWVRTPLSIMLDAIGQRHTAAALRAGGPRSAASFWRIAHARKEYERNFEAELARRDLAALVMPPYAVPAFLHGQSIDLLAAASYAFLPNLLGLPTGVVPFTRVRRNEESDRPRSRDWAEQAAAKAERGSAGLPIGVQIVARPWREDVALALLAALESHVTARGEMNL